MPRVGSETRHEPNQSPADLQLATCRLPSETLGIRPFLAGCAGWLSIQSTRPVVAKQQERDHADLA